MEVVTLIIALVALLMAIVANARVISDLEIRRLVADKLDDELNHFARSIGLQWHRHNRTVSGSLKKNILPGDLDKKLKLYDKNFEKIGLNSGDEFLIDHILTRIYKPYSTKKEAKPFTLVEKVEQIMKHLKLEERTTATTELVKVTKKK